MVGRTSRVTKAPTRFQDDDGKLSFLAGCLDVPQLVNKAVVYDYVLTQNVIFSVDFYLIKFVEDGVRRVLSRDKIKIQDDDVEAGSPCEAYWEDTQTKGWFSAIILAFGGKFYVC